MQPFAKALAVLAMGAAASAQQFNLTLEGSQEVPPVVSTGNGTATVTVDTVTGAIKVEGTYTNLTSPAIDAHVHGPAPVGSEAGILLPLTVSGGITGTFNGTGTLTPSDVTSLLTGLLYVNVHTSLFTGGEIRAQIVEAGYAIVYGGNPTGSLTFMSGTVKINNDFTLGVDNPLGTQTPGSFPFIGISTGQDPSYILTGTGTLVPGWGMSGAAGELLISVAAPSPQIVLTGNPWIGPGIPAPIKIHIPNQLPLIGIKVYAQGVLIDPVAASPKFGLTNAMELDIGL